MDDLVTWLRQQLDDDERVAREADPEPTAEDLEFGDWRSAWEDPYDPVHPQGGPIATHIQMHKPARVLAEVDAKRRIMAIHNRRADVYPGDAGGTFDNCCDGCGYEGICDDPVTENINDCPILRALALPYAGRPGCRDEWRLL